MSKYIDRDALLERLDGIWDCNDITFPNGRDYICKPEDCGGCKWRDVLEAFKDMVKHFNTEDVEPVKRRRWTPPLLDDIKSAGFYERCSELWKSVGVPLPRKKRKQDGQGANQVQKAECLLLPQLDRERKSEAEAAYLLSVLVREFNAGYGLNVKVADRIAELAHMQAKEDKHGTAQA